MKFLPMHELLRPAWKQQYAIPAFCAWNGEVMETILQVATDLKAPVILMNGPGEFPLNPPDTMGRIASASGKPERKRTHYQLREALRF